MSRVIVMDRAAFVAADTLRKIDRAEHQWLRDQWAKTHD